MGLLKSKVNLYAAIRSDHCAGLSLRAPERKCGMAWRTVRSALDLNRPERMDAGCAATQPGL